MSHEGGPDDEIFERLHHLDLELTMRLQILGCPHYSRRLERAPRATERLRARWVQAARAPRLASRTAAPHRCESELNELPRLDAMQTDRLFTM